MQDVLSSYFFSLLGRKVLECSRLPLRLHCTLADCSWKYFFQNIIEVKKWVKFNVNARCSLLLLIFYVGAESSWIFLAASKIALHTGRLHQKRFHSTSIFLSFHYRWTPFGFPPTSSQLLIIQMGRNWNKFIKICHCVLLYSLCTMLSFICHQITYHMMVG